MNLRRALTGLLVSLAMSAPALCQASLSCQVRPGTLAAMRNCYRPLLVFSPRANDPRLRKQSQWLDAAADDMMDRFVLLVPVIASLSDYQAPYDTPYALLGASQRASVRARFRIPEERFEVLLLGEDGSVKLRSLEPVSVDRLNSLIDSMPARKKEMLRRGAN